MVLLRFKEFHGLQDDIKIYEKHLNPGGYSAKKIC